MRPTVDRMSVRSLLLGAGDADASGLVARSVEDQGVGATVGGAVGGMTGRGRSAVCDEVGHVADSLLDIDITDVLFAGWRKHSDLVAAARRTFAAPGSEELVLLATHKITSKHCPHVDVRVDDVVVTRVDMELTLTLLVRGMLGVVTDGRLVGLRGGEADVTGVWMCEHVKLVERRTTYDLPGEVQLGAGIDLLPAGAQAPVSTTPAPPPQDLAPA